MGRPRDSQRSKVYAAERKHSEWKDAVYTLGGSWTTTQHFTEQGERIPIPTIQETRAFVNKIVKSAWFKRRWPRRSLAGVYIKDGRGTRNATGSNTGTLNFPRWSRFPLVICHELAHVVTSSARRSHGRVYCHNYLAIVRHVMGKEASDELKRCFKEGKVKYTLPAGVKPHELARRR